MTLSVFPVYPITISPRKAIALIDKALAHHVINDGAQFNAEGEEKGTGYFSVEDSTWSVLEALG